MMCLGMGCVVWLCEREIMVGSSFVDVALSYLYCGCDGLVS